MFQLTESHLDLFDRGMRTIARVIAVVGIVALAPVWIPVIAVILGIGWLHRQFTKVRRPPVV